MTGGRQGMGWAGLTPTVQGAALALAGAVAFSAMGALMRILSLEMPTATILFFRSAFSLPVMLAWIVLARHTGRLRTRHLVWHFARAMAGITSLACLILAYRSLDFALATALAFTTPLWVIVLSVLFLGERPSWHRSAATLLGFVGVLIIVRPVPLWEVGVWAALASGVFGAVALSFLRHLVRLESAETTLLYFFLFSTLISAGPALHAGHMPDPRQMALLLAAAGAGMAGLAFAAHAYAVADATVVAPFDFMRLPIAAAIGFVFFAQTPDPWLLLGAGVMVAALYMIVVFGRWSSALDPATGEGANRLAAAEAEAPPPSDVPPQPEKGQDP